MREVKVEGRLGPSRVLVGEKLAALASHVDPARTLIVTDPNVERIYAGSLPPAVPVHCIGTGEGQKNFRAVESIWEELIRLEADRGWTLVGLGGGIVTDVAGFAASTFLRGIRFGFVSTSLLAQIDASVGGKNGVNVGRLKNMAGCFRQPDFVILDPELPRSLPVEEYRSGLAEAVKHGIIADASYFSFIEAEAAGILARDAAMVEELVHGSVRIKAAVVNADEEEAGPRKKLNFGHSLGHALELATGLPHGYAVAVGMGFAARLSRARGLLDDAGLARIIALLRKLGLPTDRAEAGASGLPLDLAGADEVIAAFRHDKKRTKDSIDFVLCEGIGKARIERMPLSEVETAIREEWRR